MGLIKRRKVSSGRSSIFRIFQPIQKRIQKLYQYLRASFHILLRIQPFLSIFLAILISVPLALAVVFALDNASGNNSTKIYKEGVLGSINNIDPLPSVPFDRSFSQTNRDITRFLLDPLFTTDINGILKGQLAHNYEIKDNGNKFIVKINDRKWSNGEDVLAKDVVTTFNTIKKQGASGIFFSAVDGVSISEVDNKTVQFVLDSPSTGNPITNVAFLETLYWPVLPAANLSNGYDAMIASEFSKNPITNTNWKLTNITKESAYIENKELKKRIQFVFYSNYIELDKALNAGIIDGYYTLDKPIEKNYTNIYSYILPRQVYSLYFNLGDSGSPLLRDPFVRQAISYALDRSEVSGDMGKVRRSVIDENSWAYNESINTYAYNVPEANKILDAAGYKKTEGDLFRKQDGKELAFTLAVPSIPTRKNQARIIKSQLQEIGIRVEIKEIQDAQFIDNKLKTNLFYNSVVLTKNFEAMIFSVDSNLDPDKFSQWHSSNITDPSKNQIGLNFSSYNNFRVDEFLRRGRSNTDINFRKTTYSQFQKVFYDEAPVVTLYNPYVFYVTSKRVKNIDFTNAIRVEDRFINFNNWTY